MQIHWTIFDWAFVAMNVALYGLRFPFARQLRHKKPVAQYISRIERLLMALTILGFMVAPLVYLATNILGFADYPRADWVGWLGIAVAVMTVWLFWRSHVDLGRQWSPTLEVFETHAVVTHGVYRRMRHPMYAAVWLWAISQAFLLPNWIAGPAALTAFAPMYLLRVPREERMMVEHFGDAYAHYAARTGRIFPRLPRD
jgi:protein-S-isoprenylcysteine O-methyltransferase Ste14